LISESSDFDEESQFRTVEEDNKTVVFPTAEAAELAALDCARRQIDKLAGLAI
jgi:hypothetical protein